MLKVAISIVLAPVGVSAVAVPWTLPQPAFLSRVAKIWSPTPTAHPLIRALGVLTRDIRQVTCEFEPVEKQNLKADVLTSESFLIPSKHHL